MHAERQEKEVQPSPLTITEPIIEVGYSHPESGKVTPMLSLNPDLVRHIVAADCTAGVKNDGKIFITNRIHKTLYIVSPDQVVTPIAQIGEDDQIIDFIEEGIDQMCIAIMPPVAPWGSHAALFLTLPSQEHPLSYHDYDTEISEQAMLLQQKYLRAIMEEARKTGHPVAALGKNNTAGCLLSDQGGQTILHAHEQVFMPPTEITPQHVLARRQESSSNIDLGVSRNAGQKMVDWMEATLHHSGVHEFSLTPDSMGFSLDLPISVEQWNGELIEKVLRPLFDSNHMIMREMNRTCFDSRLDDQIEYVTRASNDEIPTPTKEEFRDMFFQPATGEPVYGFENLRTLRDQGILKHPPGWALGVLFYEDQGRPRALLTVTYTIIDKPGHNMGPVEGLGMEVRRERIQFDSEPDSKYQQLRDQRLQNHWRMLHNAVADLT